MLNRPCNQIVFIHSRFSLIFDDISYIFVDILYSNYIRNGKTDIEGITSRPESSLLILNYNPHL